MLAWWESHSANLSSEAVGSLGAALQGGSEEGEGVNKCSHKEKLVQEQRQNTELSPPPALRALACAKDLHLF